MKHWHATAILFIIVCLVYLSNCRTIGSGDTISASLLPFSILANQNLYLDQFNNYFITISPYVYWAKEVNGHHISTYPIVTPILITPLYIFPYILMSILHIPVDVAHPWFMTILTIMEKFAASFIAALAVVFVFASLRELTDRTTALITALIFAFATNTWATSSQALWQHGMVELLLAASIYLIILNEKQNKDKYIIALGILSGLFAFNRPIDSILLIPVVFYILSLRDKRIAYYMCSAFLISLPFIYYNMHYFGSIFGGYNSLINGFHFDQLEGTAGLLISPSRGIFIYTPIIIFAVLGYFKIRQIPNDRIKNFLFVMGIAILALLYVYGSFALWWAGWSYGPRFLAGALPVLMVYLGLYIKDINRKNLLVISIFVILLVWSIFAQFVGAFYYPNGNWDEESNVDPGNTGKLWDWKDTPMTGSFLAGPAPRMDYINVISNMITQLRLATTRPAQNSLSEAKD